MRGFSEGRATAAGAILSPIIFRGSTAVPRGPKGQKRPADVIGNAVHVMKIATGEIAEAANEGKNKAAVELGRKGGTARAKSLSAKKRREIAKRAAGARWRS